MTPIWLRYLPTHVRQHLEGRSYLQRLVSNTGWMLAERILRYTLGPLVGIWIARYLGPEQYGLLNYAAAIVIILGFMSTVGLDSLAVREMVRDPSSRDEMLGTLLLARLVGGIALIGLAITVIPFMVDSDPRILSLILIISTAQLLQAFDSIDCWFQSILASRYTVFAKLVALITITAVRVVLILTKAPLIAFAWAILAESLLLAVSMLATYHMSGQRLAAFRPKYDRLKTLILDGWPMMLSALLAAAYLRVDQVMLGHLGGFQEVGAYAVAVRVVEVTFIIPAVLGASAFPALVESRGTNISLYRARVQQFFDGMVWLGIAVAIPLALFAPTLVTAIAGVAYATAGPVIKLLAWMTIWVFFDLARQRWLYAENALREALAIEIVAFALNILTNFILIPRYGAIGAAGASLISIASAPLLLAPFSSRLRQSLRMFVISLLAPIRLLRQAIFRL